MGNKRSKLTGLSPQSINELRQNVDYTTEEIQAWYDEYRSSLGSKQTELTKTEFKKVYNLLFIGDATSFSEHIFRTFDTDGSGTVNFKEFLIGLCVSGRDCNTDAKLEWAFRMYDINGDGYITKDEMIEILEAIIKMTNALLPEGVNSAEDMANAFFDRVDLNHDGKISKEEFKKGAREDLDIIRLLECDPEANVEK